MRSCTCSKCVAACLHVPGMFAPVEALRAIRAGLAPRLMSVWVWDPPKHEEHEGWNCLAPLSFHDSTYGYRWSLSRRDCALSAAGTCTFLHKGRCEIHDSGFKPMECRVALPCGDEDSPWENVRVLWNTFVGRKVVEIWERELQRPPASEQTRPPATKGT